MPSAPGESKTEQTKGSLWARLLIVGVFVAVSVFFLLRAPTDSRDLVAQSSSAVASGGATPFGAASRARCSLATSKPAFRVGGDGSGPVAVPSSRDGGAADGGDEDDEGQRFAPFAVLLGRGVHSSEGFAVGVRRDTSEGGVAEVVVIDPDTGSGRVVALGASRGDVAAPLLAPVKGGLLAALLEPNAGGFSTRLARITGGELSWGEDLPQGRDESLAFDLAVQGGRAVVAWDATNRKGDRLRILVAGLSVEGLSVDEPAAPVSPEEYDAELPRMVPRTDGFWLVYVAHRDIELPPNPNDDDLRRDPKQERYAGEMIEASWLEVLPLDVNGRPAGAAQPLTPREGHVQAFDVERVAPDAAVVAWRDDDTPTGAQGGHVSVVVVRSDGLGEPRVVADRDVGLGAPNLLPGWLSLAGRGGEVRLAPLDTTGLPRGQLMAEPALGVGQLIAADANSLLLARPSGRVVDLVLAQCAPEEVAAPSDAAAGAGGG